MEKKISSKAQQTVFRHFIDRIVPLSFDVPTAKVRFPSENFSEIPHKNEKKNH